MKVEYKNYKTTLICREPNEIGESIEEMLRRATENKEAIEARDPMLYTPKADGVRPEYNIRTDRQEIALDAVDKFSKSIRARKDENPFVKQANEIIQSPEPPKNE